MTITDPFAGIPNAEDAERHQFDNSKNHEPGTSYCTSLPEHGHRDPFSSETTTQLAYETAVARYCAVSDQYERLIKQLMEMQAAVELEMENAGQMLRSQERKPGVHKPFTTAELDLDDLDMLEAEAQENLAKLLPWANLTPGSGL